MEENQNIDKFFRDKFNQPVKKEPWNSPDDYVWANIADSLEVENKKRRLFSLPSFITGCLLASLLLSAWLHCSQHKKISDLQKEVAICQNVRASGAENGINKKGGMSGKQVLSYPSRTDNSKKVISDTKMKTRPDITKSVNLPHATQAFNDTKAVEDNINHPLFLPEELPEVQNLSGVKVVAQPISLMYPMVNLDMSPIILTIQKPVYAKQRGISFLGFSMGSALWMDQEKGTMNHPLSELLVEEKSYISPVVGLQFLRQLSEKWSFTAGLEYYKRTQYSLYSIALPYSKDTEIESGSNYENHFQHSLPSGLGNVNTFLVLARSSDSQLSNNEIVSLDFAMNQQASLLSMPVGFSFYPLGKAFGPFLTGGLRTEFVMNTRVSDVMLKSHHPLVQDNHVNVEYNNLQMNKLNLSVTMGLGYQIPLWRDYHLSGVIQYGQALNPVFRSENYIHDINSLNGQVIISKKL